MYLYLCISVFVLFVYLYVFVTSPWHEEKIGLQVVGCELENLCICICVLTYLCISMFVYLCVPWPEEKIGLQASGGLRAGARDSAFSGAGAGGTPTVRNAKAHGHSTLVPCTSLHSALNALCGI